MIGYIVTFGNNSNFTLNAICVAFGTMPEGGWYKCPNSMTGIVFSVYSTTQTVNFMEIMAYSQDAI